MQNKVKMLLPPDDETPTHYEVVRDGKAVFVSEGQLTEAEWTDIVARLKQESSENVMKFAELTAKKKFNDLHNDCATRKQ